MQQVVMKTIGGVVAVMWLSFRGSLSSSYAGFNIRCTVPDHTLAQVLGSLILPFAEVSSEMKRLDLAC